MAVLAVPMSRTKATTVSQALEDRLRDREHQPDDEEKDDDCGHVTSMQVAWSSWAESRGPPKSAFSELDVFEPHE